MMMAGCCFADELSDANAKSVDNIERVEDINNLFVEDAAAEEIVPIKEETQIQAESNNSDDSTIDITLPQDKKTFNVAEHEEKLIHYNENEQQSQETLQGFLEFNEPSELESEKNAVHLDSGDISKNINFTNPKKIISKSLLGSKKPIFTPMGSELSAASRFSSQEYMINPISTSYSQKVGKFTFGTVYNASLDSASTNYTTSVFSKFEGKRFAFSTAFAKDTNLNESTFGDKIYIIPELKLTKRLSLLNVMQTDVNQINKKSEMVLRYTPNLKNRADDVQFEVGAGQTFYNDDYVKSSLRFSTKFKL